MAQMRKSDFAMATEYHLPKCIYQKVINISCEMRVFSINFAWLQGN